MHCISHIWLAWKYKFLIKLLIKFNMTENSLERGHPHYSRLSVLSTVHFRILAVYKTDEIIMLYTVSETINKILDKWKKKKADARVSFALVHCTKYKTSKFHTFHIH